MTGTMSLRRKLTIIWMIDLIRMRYGIVCLCIALMWYPCFGQHRTYIIGQHDDVLHRDLFVVEMEDGALEYHIGMSNSLSPRDTVHMVMSREQCEQMREALVQLRDKFSEWAAAAKKHGVRDYSRPFEIELPAVAFEWRSEYQALIYRAHGPVHRMDGVKLAPMFVVSGRGLCSVKIEAMLCAYGLDGDGYEFETYISGPASFRKYIRMCDVRWVNRQFNKLRIEPGTKEFYDSLFK